MESPISILIVDDDNAIGISLKAFFEDYGFTADHVTSAGAALEQLKAKAYHAAIVDLGLPEINGRDLIRILLARSANILIFIYTGSSGYRIPDDLLIHPQICKKVFQKPLIDMDELKEEILRLTANRERKE